MFYNNNLLPLRNTILEIGKEKISNKFYSKNINEQNAQNLMNVFNLKLDDLTNSINMKYFSACNGNIPRSAVEGEVSMYLTSLFKAMVEQSGGILQQQSPVINLNPGIGTPSPNIYSSTPIVSTPKEEDISILKPKKKEVKIKSGEIYVENETKDDPLQKKSEADTPTLTKAAVANIVNINAIIKYRHTSNNSEYSLYKLDYLIPETTFNDVYKNLEISIPNIMGFNKYMLFVNYNRFSILSNIIYDDILRDYNDVKKVYISQGGFKEAIKVLKNKTFNFANEIKRMMVADINEMLNRYVRSVEAIDEVLRIDDLDDIMDLFSINRTLGIKAFMIDDFDGLILNIITEVFSRYFGRNSKIFTIENDIKHILANKEIVIRNSDFTERDYYELEDNNKEKYIKELKNYAVFGVTESLILTNIFPNSIKDKLDNFSMYMVNKPGSSFESLIMNNVKDNKGYNIKIKNGSDMLDLKLGKTIEGVYCFSLIE